MKRFKQAIIEYLKVGLILSPFAIIILIWLGIATFWCLVIYGLYLLVTGQLHVG